MTDTCVYVGCGGEKEEGRGAKMQRVCCEAYTVLDSSWTAAVIDESQSANSSSTGMILKEESAVPRKLSPLSKDAVAGLIILISGFGSTHYRHVWHHLTTGNIIK